MKPRLLTYIRLAQLICGCAVFLLGLWMWWRMFLIDHSNGSDAVWLMLMIVAPGIFVAVGSFLQAAYRKVWPAALVLLGSAVVLWFIGLGAQFIFGYIGDGFALHAVYADLVLLVVTVAASLMNAIVDLVLHFSKTGVEQAVGADRPSASLLKI
jgi:hypothetical protein